MAYRTLVNCMNMIVDGDSLSVTMTMTFNILKVLFNHIWFRRDGP